MVHTFSELYELMPKKDCGSCGNPTCRTAARKIAVGELKPDVCVNMKKEDIERIEKLLKGGVKIGSKAEVVLGESGITYIHPCVSEKGKVMAEARLDRGPEGAVDLKYGFFDPYMMCYIIQNCGFFKDAKCSSKLGIAKIEHEGKTIIINQNGKIDVRKALSREDALETVRFVSRVLWGSIICSCCGNCGVDCASGGCDDCAETLCPVLGGGPPQPGIDTGETVQTDGKTTFIRVDNLKTGHLFMEGFEILKIALNKILSGDLMVDEDIEKATRKGMEFTIKTQRVQDASLGLILDGIATDVKRIKEGFYELECKEPGKEEKKFLDEAKEIVKDAFLAFESTDWEKASGVKEKYKKFDSETRDYYKKQMDKEIKSILISIEKIATNGFYVARLVSKPIPR